MNWDAIGAVGETIGALAVLVTLVYLALQLRVQNQVAKAQMHQQRADSVVPLASMLTQSEESTNLCFGVVSGDINVAELSKVELFQAKLLFSPLRANLENTYDQYVRGYISEELYRDVAVKNCETYGQAILDLKLPLSNPFKKELMKIVKQAKKHQS